MARAETKGAPGAGLYIRIPHSPDLEKLVPQLRQLFHVTNASAHEKNMHVLEIAAGGKDDVEFREKSELLIAIARHNGITCIMRGGDAAVAKDIGFEGILALSYEEFTAARTVFGNDGIVGLACGTSQEMTAWAHDEGADFAAFGTGKNDSLPPIESLRFWTILNDKPSVIEGPVTNDYAAFFIQAGAMFLDCGDYIFSHEKGVMQGTVNMLHAIDLALAATQQTKQ